MREYATAAGERATIQLSEGTTVRLAPKTRLIVPRDFGRSTRRLELVGQASFDVVHDASMPFSVRSGDAVIEDIGTYFTVSAYANEEVVVQVTEGETKIIGKEGAPVSLRAGAAGKVSTGGVAAYVGPVSAHVRDWERGQLAFTDDSVATVVNTLERWFDLDIRVDPSLAARRVTGVFIAARPTEMLDALATALDAQVSRDGDTVVLSRRKP